MPSIMDRIKNGNPIELFKEMLDSKGNMEKALISALNIKGTPEEQKDCLNKAASVARLVAENGVKGGKALYVVAIGYKQFIFDVFEDARAAWTAAAAFAAYLGKSGEAKDVGLITVSVLIDGNDLSKVTKIDENKQLCLNLSANNGTNIADCMTIISLDGTQSYDDLKLNKVVGNVHICSMQSTTTKAPAQLVQAFAVSGVVSFVMAYIPMLQVMDAESCNFIAFVTSEQDGVKAKDIDYPGYAEVKKVILADRALCEQKAAAGK